jgi:hypothetical protein
MFILLSSFSLFPINNLLLNFIQSYLHIHVLCFQEKDRLITNLKIIQDYLCSFKSQVCFSTCVCWLTACNRVLWPCFFFNNFEITDSKFSNIVLKSWIMMLIENKFCFDVLFLDLLYLTTWPSS